MVALFFVIVIAGLVVGGFMISKIKGPVGQLDERLQSIEQATQATARQNTAAGKACPKCAEIVKRAAVVCRFCGHEFDPATISYNVNLVLASAGDLKINAIKHVRELTGLGLRQAKELVETAPTTLLKDVEQEEALRVQQLFRKIGATVEIV